MSTIIVNLKRFKAIWFKNKFIILQLKIMLKELTRISLELD